MTTSSASSSRSPAEPLSVAFLVEELGRSGGAQVVYRYARHLAEREGMRCELVVTHPKAPLGADVGVPVRRTADARGGRYDVAIATWWTTAEALFELDAGRRALFLQNLEHRFYSEHELPDRLGAATVFDLPVDYIVIARYMERLLAYLRSDARCLFVPNGIDKAVFRARDPRAEDGPLRVLVEGQPTLWFKGVREAVAAARGMSEPARITVCVHDPADAEGLDADRVTGGRDARGMAELYGEHDVLLKLSRFEGSPLPPLEAAHVGLPSVVTPFTGHDELVSHGENGLVVGFDDEAGTAAALDVLARDRQLLRRLGAGALADAERWPSMRDAAAGFARAVRTLAYEREQQPAGPVWRRVARGRRFAVELEREHQNRAERTRQALSGEVAWYRSAYEQAKQTAVHWHGAAEARSRDMAALAEQLEATRRSRAYRVALGLRRLASLGRRGR